MSKVVTADLAAVVVVSALAEPFICRAELWSWNSVHSMATLRWAGMATYWAAPEAAAAVLPATEDKVNRRAAVAAERTATAAKVRTGAAVQVPVAAEEELFFREGMVAQRKVPAAPVSTSAAAGAGALTVTMRRPR